MIPPYIGKIEYCYSNSTSMLLVANGETIDPSLIEVMTGMGIGAQFDPKAGVMFFDCTEPDIGISRALTGLGFEFAETSTNDPRKAPFDELRGALSKGPVILGPLEFAKLVYNPAHVGSTDSDHYVLAYGFDDKHVTLHDPWGFPCTKITYHDLESAWRADAIDYKRGYFRSWSHPVRKHTPSQQELYETVIQTCQHIYKYEQAQKRKSGLITGPTAIEKLAESIQDEKPTEWLMSFLSKFSLPLSAKRSLDYAKFFKEHNEELSNLKFEMATLFGGAGTQVVAQRPNELMQTLKQLSEKEALFEKEIMRLR